MDKVYCSWVDRVEQTETGENVMSLPKAKFVGFSLFRFQVVEETQVLMRKIVKQVDFCSAKLSCLIFK